MSAFDDLAARLRTAERGVMQKFSARILLIESKRPWIVGVGVVGAMVAACSRLFDGTTGVVMAIVGAFVATVSGLLVALFDYRKLELGAELREAEILAEDAIALGREVESAFEARNAELVGLLEGESLAAGERTSHRQFMLSALTALQQAGERAPPGLPIARVIEAMLDAAMSDLIDAFGFDGMEHWTISIFMVVPAGEDGSEVMQRIVARWWDRAAEQDEARDWRSGEGYTGYAWRNRNEVIESDARLLDVARHYSVPADKRKSDDDTRYVSVACVPVIIGVANTVWGAVTATSNKVGRFQRDVTDLRALNVDVVRQIAVIIAVQVSLRAHQRSAGS